MGRRAFDVYESENYGRGGKIRAAGKAFFFGTDNVGGKKTEEDVKSQLLIREKDIKPFEQAKFFNTSFSGNDAQNVLNTLRATEAQLKTDENAFTNYFKGLDEGNKWQEKFVAENDLSRASIGSVIDAQRKAYDAALRHDEGLKQLTIGAKAASVGMKALNLALNVGIAALVSLAITGVVKAYKWLTGVTEKAKEAQDEYNQTFEDIESAKSRLEDIGKKIDEINAKPSLSIIEEAELEKLENEKDLLDSQVKLLEKKAELEKENANKESKDAANSSRKGLKFTAPKNKEDWNRLGANGVEEGLKGAALGAAVGTIIPVVGTAAGAAIGGAVGLVGGTIKSILQTDADRLKNYSADIESYKKQLESGDLDADEFSDIKDKMAERQSQLLQIKEDNIAILAGITGTDKSSIEAREKLLQQNDEINKAIYGDGAEYQSIKFNEFIETVPDLSEAYKQLSSDGKVTEDEIESLAEKFSTLKTYMTENGLSAKDLTNSLNEVQQVVKKTEEGATSLGAAMTNLKEDYSLYNEIVSSYSSNLTLSNEDLSKIATKYSDLSDEVYEYTMGLRDAKSLIQALYEKTEQSKLMSSSAFRDMYLATDDVTEEIEKSFIGAFSLVEYDYDNTKSVMENINSSIVDATGVVTENFKNQWKAACQSAGADVQNFAAGYSSIMLGKWYDGTKGVYKSENKGFYYKNGTGLDGAGTNLTNVLANDLMDKYGLDTSTAYKKAYDILDREFSESKDRQKAITKEQAEYEKKLRENEIKDANKQLANAEKEAKKKLSDHDKTDRLESLKADITEHQKILDAYEKQVEVLDWGNELFGEKDYSGKIGVYGEKLTALSDYTKSLRAEMERLLTIEPQTGDEAVEIANQFEALGEKLRENASTMHTLNSELMGFKIDALSASSSSFFEQVDRQIDIVDKKLSLLDSKNPDASSLSALNVISPDMLFADLSSFNDPIKKKKNETKQLIKEEQSRQNKINKIVSDAVKRQNADNKKERDRERAEILKDLGDLTSQIVSKVGLTSEQVKAASADTTQSIISDLDSVETKLQSTINKFSELAKTSVGNYVMPKWTPTEKEETRFNTLYKILKLNGISDNGALAILGNFKAESSFNNNAYGDYVNGKATSYGLAQWHNGRWDSLKNYASERGLDVSSDAAQIGYLIKELKSYGLYDLFSKDDVSLD